MYKCGCEIEENMKKYTHLNFSECICNACTKAGYKAKAELTMAIPQKDDRHFGHRDFNIKGNLKMGHNRFDDDSLSENIGDITPNGL